MSAPLYGEVCAGVGGLSRGLELAGLRAAFHAEIAPLPRRVLAHHGYAEKRRAVLDFVRELERRVERTSTPVPEERTDA